MVLVAKDMQEWRTSSMDRPSLDLHSFFDGTATTLQDRTDTMSSSAMVRMVGPDPLWRLLQDGNETDDQPPADDDEVIDYNDNEVLRSTFAVYGSLMLVAVLLFCWVRLRFPRAFTLRQWVEGIQTDLAKDQFGFFSWMYKVYGVTDDQLMDECGMDALCFIRLTRMGYKLATVGIFNAIWLLVVYKTADAAPDTSTIDESILEISISHVPEESLRFVATALAAYVFFGYAMYLILEDFKWFTEKRHVFLSKPKPRNYSIFVRNIPPNFRNNQALAFFMESCFSEQAVMEASVSVTAGKLAKTQAERAATLWRLEHALGAYEVYDKRPTHHTGVVGTVGLGTTVDSIDTYKEELIKLNEKVDEEISAMLLHIESLNTTPAMSATDDEAIVVREETNDDKEAEERDKVRMAQAGEALNEMGEMATVTVGDAVNTAGKVVTGAAADAIQLATGAMNMLTGMEDGIPHSSGFVVFSDLATTNAALQMVSHSTPFCMEILEAPDPHDIIWLNVGRTHKDLELGQLMSVACTITVCLFWTIPMSFIASISNLEGLREEFEFIDDMLDAAPFLAPLLEVLAPLLVVLANYSLRVISRAVTLLEGLVSGPAIEASLFTKLGYFMVIQTFFISAISGSLVDKLNEMIETPGIIVETLATALPAQATYFLQLSFVNMVVTFCFEALRLYPIGVAILRIWIGPRLTEKEKSTGYWGLNPLCEPFQFELAYYTSLLVFYFMVLLVYAVISPLTTFVQAFVFVVLNTLFRHQFIFIYPPVSDSGGKIWLSFIRIFINCMLVAEFTILGLLSLKKAYVASPMFIPLLVITFLFSSYIHQEHFKVAEFLPMRSCMRQDSIGPDLDFLKGSYLQPELKADRHVWPDDVSDLQKQALGESPNYQMEEASARGEGKKMELDTSDEQEAEKEQGLPAENEEAGEKFETLDSSSDSRSVDKASTCRVM